MLDDTRSTSTSPGTARRPTRGADRNRDRVDRAGPSNDGRLLPTLDPGVTLLDVEGGRGVRVVQSLVLDRLLLCDGPAVWVDAAGYATTTSLAGLAPGRRLLDRIHVARGFTAPQHFGAVRALPRAVNRRIRDGADPRPPAIVVAPAVDARYRDGDALGTAQARRLQARTLARLARYADGYDAPVLVTRTGFEGGGQRAADEFAAAVERAADHRLTCERTRMGPRFAGEDFETLVYPVAGGAVYQTTLAYWRELLGARAEQVGLDAAPTTGPVDPADGVGTGVTADGERTTLAADPLADARGGSPAGGR